MSYTDPEALYAKLTSGDPCRVTAVTDPITDANSALERAKLEIEAGNSTIGDSWQGVAADAFGNRADLTQKAVVEASNRLRQGIELIKAAANAQATMRTGADRAIAAWRSRPRYADQTPESHQAERELAERVVRALNEVRTAYEQVLHALVEALNGMQPGFESTAGASSSRQTTPQRLMSVPPAEADPREIAEWWKSLSEEERTQLMLTRYDELGRLRGLPTEVVHAANERRIVEDKQRFDAERNDLDRRISERAEALGLNPNDKESLRKANDRQLSDLLDKQQEAQRRFNNADNAFTQLNDARELARKKGFDGEAYVMAWEPNGPRGQGDMAIAFGDPDTAKNLAVCVPGTGSHLGNFSIGQAANLREKMGPGNATIQWLGYDAPEAINSYQVTQHDQAAEGGPRLVADVDGYRAAAEAAGNHQHLTVIGHSYGSTVVGDAGMHGLKAEDIVFVGSPGVGASSADQFPMGHDHVWAGATEHDPVVQLTGGEWFTYDGKSTGPYDGSFGARQFGTPDDTFGPSTHSVYYDPNSESLDNLSKIATGNYGDVSSPRWQDRPLGPELPGSNLPGVGPVIDSFGTAGKEIVDGGGEIIEGGPDAIGRALDGEWQGAGRELREGFVEGGKDIADGVVEIVGDGGEGARDGAEGLVDAGKSAWDNTLDRLFQRS